MSKPNDEIDNGAMFSEMSCVDDAREMFWASVTIAFVSFDEKKKLPKGFDNSASAVQPRKSEPNSIPKYILILNSHKCVPMQYILLQKAMP